MLFPASGSRGEALVQICHQLPGRTRLRVPAVIRSPRLESQVVAALTGIDGVLRVRLNPACASLVLHHRTDCAPTLSGLQAALRPILKPAPSSMAPAGTKSVRCHVQAASRRAAGAKREDGQLALACPICQLKLKAARWILTDVWRCWRDHWAQRLRGHWLASLALFRP